MTHPDEVVKSSREDSVSLVKAVQEQFEEPDLNSPHAA